MPEQTNPAGRGVRAPEYFLVSRRMRSRFRLREQQLAAIMGPGAAGATMRAWIGQYAFWYVGVAVLVTGVWAQLSNLVLVWVLAGVSGLCGSLS